MESYQQTMQRQTYFGSAQEIQYYSVVSNCDNTYIENGNDWTVEYYR